MNSLSLLGLSNVNQRVKDLQKGSIVVELKLGYDDKFPNHN